MRPHGMVFEVASTPALRRDRAGPGADPGHLVGRPVTSRPTSTATATSSRPALAKYCEAKLGVRRHYGTEVKSLRRNGDRIAAVETSPKAR